MTAVVGYLREPESKVEALVIHDEESGDRIEVQRSLTFDEQDRRLGMNTYCLVRQGASHYGGLQSWTIESGLLHLKLSSPAAAALELPAEFSIAVGADGEELLKEHLRRLTA